MLPRGVVQKPPVLLEGAGAERVTPFGRILEDLAPGIDERCERRIVDEQLVLLLDGGPELLGHPGAVHCRFPVLIRQSVHVEQVEPAASALERGGDGLLDGLVGVSLAQNRTDLLIMGVRGELDRPSVLERTVHIVEVLHPGTVEQLDDDVVLDTAIPALLEEALGVSRTVLPQIPDDEYRGVQVGLDDAYVLCELLGAPEGGLLPAYHVPIGEMGPSAFGAVDRAPADGEHGGQGELVPPVPGQGPFDVHIPHDVPDHHAVVELDGIQRIEGIGQTVVVDLPVIVLPDQVRDLRQVPSPLQGLHHPDRWHLGGVPAHDQIDLGAPDELLPEVGRCEASELDLGIGMVLLDDLRQFESPMGMRHPVEVDGEHVRIDLPDAFLRVEGIALEHPDRYVQDPRAEAGLHQLGAYGHEPDGIHLEHGRRRDDIGYGPVEYGLLTEIVDAGCMQEDYVPLHRITCRSA